jgi:RNA polymerase sigma-70 factor (ECF subfamily)
MDDMRARIDEIYRTQSRRVFATLVRLVGNFDLAEEAMHEAFAAAMQRWPGEGLPANPRAWLVSTGRFKAIDVIRRRARFDASTEELARQYGGWTVDEPLDEQAINDDQLRLIFTCCHPALSPQAQVALTLREVCGLTTEEIASAFLAAPTTIAQRIVRGKSKIRDAGIPYQVPSQQDIPERLGSVLAVVYLVFNEGYFATSGESLTRQNLCAEAIRLGRLLRELLPDPEVIGLLALMLLSDSRRAARGTAAGDVVLLEDQDRSLWNREQIEEGTRLVETALASRRFGSYAIQAAISAVHAEAATAAETDWPQIVALYDALLSISPSPVVELNRAVAIAMRDGYESGLALIDSLLERGELEEYPLAHAAQADLLRRLERIEEARDAYRRAIAFTKQEPQRRFLTKRLSELA